MMINLMTILMSLATIFLVVAFYYANFKSNLRQAYKNIGKALIVFIVALSLKLFS